MRVEPGAWLALAAATAFGGIAVFGKLAYTQGWELAPLLATRFLVAAAVLAPFALLSRGSWRGFPRAVALGAIGYVGMTALYFTSFRALPAAAATFIFSLAPVFVAAYAWATTGPLRKTWVAGLALGVAGLAITFGGALLGVLSLVGVALAAAAALVEAALIVAGKSILRSLSPARSAWGICLGACVGYALAALPGGQLFVPRPLEAWAVLYGLAVLSTALPLLLFYAALARASPTQVAVMSSFGPVAALVLAFFALGESLPPLALVGGACILAGGFLVAVETPRAPDRGSAPADAPADPAPEGAP